MYLMFPLPQVEFISIKDERYKCVQSSGEVRTHEELG